MLYEIIDVDAQHAGIAKDVDDILAAAALLGLTTSFLGGSQRFIKIAAQPEQRGAIEGLFNYLKMTPHDPAQVNDRDDDE